MKTRKLITEVIHTPTSRDVNNENNIDNNVEETNDRPARLSKDQRNDARTITRNNQ